MINKFSINTENPINEILFVLVASFAPLILTALFATASGGGNYIFNLFGYFSGGELGLSILSVSGTIGWLIVLTKLNLNGENFWLVGLLIVTILTAAGTLGTNPKFDEDLKWYLHVILILAYTLSLVGWYAAKKLMLNAQSKYEKAQRGLTTHDPAKVEQNTIAGIIGQSDV